MQGNFETLHSKPKHLTEQVGNCKNGIMFRILLCHIERGESYIYIFQKNKMVNSCGQTKNYHSIVSLFMIFFLMIHTYDYNVQRYFRGDKQGILGFRGFGGTLSVDCRPRFGNVCVSKSILPTPSYILSCTFPFLRNPKMS